ncbi:MAG: TRAP transporter large permease [Porticoccaceae bacterium]
MISVPVVLWLTISVVVVLGGVSIAAAFGLGSFGIAYALGIDIETIFSTMVSRINSPALFALPLFIYMGILAEKSGQGERLVNFIELFIGRFKGGLGAVIVLACALFGAISGAGSAAIASIGTVLMPRAEASGYPREYLVSLVACSSILTLLIPPSIPLLILALTMQISVGAAFLTTLVPGLVMAVGYIALNQYFVRNFSVKTVEHTSKTVFIADFRKKARSASLVLLLPVVVLGGIYGGVASPTEAAGMGTIYVIILALFVYRNMTFKEFFDATIASGNLLGSLVIMVSALILLSTVLVYEGTPFILAEMVSSNFEQWQALLLINLILLVIGMIMDDISGSIVAASVLYPIAQDIGVDPLQFAAIVGVNLGLGNITPPVAPLLYMSSAVAGNVPMQKYIGYILKFIFFVNIPVLLLVTFWTDFSLFLPRMLGF